MKKLKQGDKVMFVKPYRSVQAGEVWEIDRALYIDDKLLYVYVKTDTTFFCFDDKVFFEYCKPYEVTKVVSISMSTEEELKKMRDIECKIIDEIIKKSEKQMEKEVKEYDYINPNHYKDGSMEVIDMMVKIWGIEKVIAHCEMTAFKYRMRAGKKPDQPIQRDLEKANWYINKAKELENGEN